MVKIIGIGVLGITGIAGAYGGFYLLSREKTIGDRVIKSGLHLIKSGESNTWKLAAKHSKLSDTSLIEDLVAFDSSVKNDSDLDKFKDALEKWCKDAVVKDLSDKNVSRYLKKVESRCTIPPANIREKLRKEDKSFTSNWSGKFSALKATVANDTTLEADLKTKDSFINVAIASSDTQMDVKYSDALRKWCEGQLNIEVKNESYSDIYTKVSKRCLE